MTDFTLARSLLEVHGLSGGWAETTVIEDLSLVVGHGECVAVVGRNGVGKSTLLELIVGRARRATGQIRLEGRDLSQMPVHQRARVGLGFVPQEREVFPSLTVVEHLEVAKHEGRWNVDSVFALFPSLAKRSSSLGRQLSGGEQQMLATARALIGNPKLLLMDEPSEGLAPVVVEQLVEVLRKLASDGSLGILLVEQRVDIALKLSSRCLIMDRGRIVHEAPSSELLGNFGRLSEMMGLQD